MVNILANLSKERGMAMESIVTKMDASLLAIG